MSCFCLKIFGLLCCLLMLNTAAAATESQGADLAPFRPNCGLESSPTVLRTWSCTRRFNVSAASSSECMQKCCDSSKCDVVTYHE